MWQKILGNIGNEVLLHLDAGLKGRILTFKLVSDSFDIYGTTVQCSVVAVVFFLLVVFS